METSLTKAENKGNGTLVVRSFSRDDIDTIKNTVALGASDPELSLFVEVCKSSGLNPFARQIYAIMRFNKKAGREVMTIQTSIDGLRVIAERSGKYRGQTLPVFYDKDGNEFEIWLNSEPPSACKIGVIRSDFDEPLFAVALWSSYVQTFKDGNPSALWAKMPEVMIAKVAEALALRKAFPQDMSGLYTADEMAQADNVALDEVYQQGEFDKMKSQGSDKKETSKQTPKKASKKQRELLEKFSHSSSLTHANVDNIKKALAREKLTSKQASDLIEKVKLTIEERKASEDDVQDAEIVEDEVQETPGADEIELGPRANPVTLTDEKEALRYHEELISGIMEKFNWTRAKSRSFADEQAVKKPYNQSTYRKLTDVESDTILNDVLTDQILPI